MKRYQIVAYRFNREPHNWCGGVFDGPQPVRDSATEGVGFYTRLEALEWARDVKRRLLEAVTP